MSVLSGDFNCGSVRPPFLNRDGEGGGGEQKTILVLPNSPKLGLGLSVQARGREVFNSDYSNYQTMCQRV